MFDLGWTELLLVGIVALIVVGPKDLPVMFRTVGRFVGKAKGMAREFSSAMNQAADQAGVKDVTDTIKGATDGLDKVANPLKSATSALNDSVDEVKRSMSYEPGAETTRLSKERAEAAEKIRQKSAEMAQERLDVKPQKRQLPRTLRKPPAKKRAAMIRPLRPLPRRPLRRMRHELN